MDPQALTKARSRLRVAKKAAEDLISCEDYNSFTDIWYTFLTASKNIYTVLEQGAKTSAKSRQWFEEKRKKRRGDALLDYIYQARNDDEHGLLPVAEDVPGGISIGVNKEGYSERIVFNKAPGGPLHATSMDGKPILVQQVLPHVRLSQVRGRDGKSYDPPTVHLGDTMTNNSPRAVADLTISYLESMLREAEALT